MPRDPYVPGAWAVPMGLAGVAFLAATVVAWNDVRLNLQGRPVAGHLIDTRRGSKGGPFGVYEYTVNGRNYEVNGTLTDDRTPLVDALPGDPDIARLHEDAGHGISTASIGALLGVGVLLISLVELREHRQLQALGEKLHSQGATPKRRN